MIAQQAHISPHGAALLVLPICCAMLAADKIARAGQILQIMLSSQRVCLIINRGTRGLKPQTESLAASEGLVAHSVDS